MEQDKSLPIIKNNHTQILIDNYVASCHALDKTWAEKVAIDKKITEIIQEKNVRWSLVKDLIETGEIKEGVYRVRSADDQHADGLVINIRENSPKPMKMFR